MLVLLRPIFDEGWHRRPPRKALGRYPHTVLPPNTTIDHRSCHLQDYLRTLLLVNTSSVADLGLLGAVHRYHLRATGVHCLLRCYPYY